MSREKRLATIASCVLRPLLGTLRMRSDQDIRRLFDNEFPAPVIITFWHNQILGILQSFRQDYNFKARKNVNVLTSPSRDGEILAHVANSFQMGAVRGSSSRRGSQALLELVSLIEDGRDIAITPDGPRGPRYRLQPGVITLAQISGAAILPVQARFSRCIQLKTWDKFIVPLPFSTVSITFGPKIHVPRDLDPESFEAARNNLENILTHGID